MLFGNLAMFLEIGKKPEQSCFTKKAVGMILTTSGL